MELCVRYNYMKTFKLRIGSTTKELHKNFFSERIEKSPYKENETYDPLSTRHKVWPI